MSGRDSDGGGYVGAPSTTPCDKLRLTRHLEAADPDVVENLEVGATLAVILQQGPPPVVAVLGADGSTVGAIVPTGELLDCLRQGFSFEAVIQSRDGGAIELEVRPAR